jgi:hypothetical protein
MWWSVYVEVAGDDTENSVTVEQLEQLADLLEPFSASVGGGGAEYSARLSVEAGLDRAAADQALAEFAKARDQVGLPAWPVVHLDVMTDERLDAELATPPFPEVVGVAEAAKLLAVTKQRLSQLTERQDFPPPMVRLAAGPVWLTSSINAFNRRWVRKSGRPAKAAATTVTDSNVIAIQQAVGRQAARTARPRTALSAKAGTKAAASGRYAARSAKAGKSTRDTKTGKTTSRSAQDKSARRD